MIYWKCPQCNRMKTYDPNKNMILVSCPGCMIPMKLFEEKTLEALGYGRKK